MRTGEAHTRERLLGELLLRGREREQAGRESRVQDSTYGIYHTECVQGKEKVQPHQVEHAVKALKKKTTKLNFCFPCLCCDIQAACLFTEGRIVYAPDHSLLDDLCMLLVLCEQQ